MPRLGEVAKYGTDYFLLNYKFLAKRKLEFTTELAITPNRCYWLVVLSKLQLNRKLFTLLLAKSDFHVSVFRFAFFNIFFFNFQFFRFQLSRFHFSRFCWQNPIFRFLLFKFQLFTLLLADSNFHASAWKFSVTKVLF